MLSFLRVAVGPKVHLFSNNEMWEEREEIEEKTTENTKSRPATSSIESRLGGAIESARSLAEVKPRSHEVTKPRRKMEPLNPFALYSFVAW
jgi:hypothetical protein